MQALAIEQQQCGLETQPVSYRQMFMLFAAGVGLSILLATGSCDEFGEDRLGEDGVDRSDFSSVQVPASYMEYFQR